MLTNPLYDSVRLQLLNDVDLVRGQISSNDIKSALDKLMALGAEIRKMHQKAEYRKKYELRLILLKRRFSELEEKRINGLESSGEVSRMINGVSHAILEFCNTIEDDIFTLGDESIARTNPVRQLPIVLTINCPIEDFTPSQRENIVIAIAALSKISPEGVTIKSILPGSVKITLLLKGDEVRFDKELLLKGVEELNVSSVDLVNVEELNPKLEDLDRLGYNKEELEAIINSTPLNNKQLSGKEKVLKWMFSFLEPRIIKKMFYSNLDFHNMDLSGCSLDGLTLYNPQFNGTDLSGASLTACRIFNNRVDISFNNASERYIDVSSSWGLEKYKLVADNANFHSSVLNKVDLSDSRMIGASFTSVVGEGSIFKGSVLDDAKFENSFLRNASFLGASLSGALFNRAELSGASFEWSNLEGADFSEAFLKRATFHRAKLDGAFFGGADIENAYFPASFKPILEGQEVDVSTVVFIN